MVKGSLTVRMYLSTYNAIKRMYPPVKGESLPVYFERIKEIMKGWKQKK